MTEIVGRLNGMWSPPGTVIGYHKREMRFLAVADERAYHLENGCVLLRWATQTEIDQLKFKEPRSVAEHHAIPRRLTPYGLARVYGSIRVKPTSTPRKRNLRPGGYSVPLERK